MSDASVVKSARRKAARGVAEYPLRIENVGEDTYILMSRGHHDPDDFMRAVRVDYAWPLGFPTHEWMRAIPGPKGSGFRCLYVPAQPGARGAFPATYSREAYNEDSYEAQAALRMTGAAAARSSKRSTARREVR